MYRYCAITLLVSGLLLASCSYDDKDCEAVPLNLRVSIDNQPRISKQSFTNGDHIGLYLVDYAGSEPGVLGHVFATRYFNTKYTLSGSGWHADGSKEILVGGGYSDLYAFFPYDPEMSKTSDKTNLAAYPFSIQAEQSISSAESDFLWAKTAGLSAVDPQVNILFSHLMSRLEINLKFNEESDIPADPQLKIYNTQTSCTINLRTGTVSPAGGTGIIKPYRVLTATEGFDFTYDVIVIPQSIAEGTPLFSVTSNTSTLIYETESNITVVPQNIYTFNMTVGTARPLRH